MVANAFNALGAALLALALAIRISDGTFTALVQTWYEPLLIASVVLLVLCSAASAAAAVRSRQRARVAMAPAALLAAAIFALPVVLTLAYEPRPLSSTSLDDSATSSPDAFSATAEEQDPIRRNVYQWAYAFATQPPSDLVGLEVSAIGFIHHSDDVPVGQFRLARFVVACCVADARGFSIPVQWDASGGLLSDGWVRVIGRIGTDSDGLPIVAAARVEPIDAPTNPYIYP
jgi:uncharacterized repeat protein (TIGR03943 family)